MRDFGLTTEDLNMSVREDPLERAQYDLKDVVVTVEVVGAAMKKVGGG